MAFGSVVAVPGESLKGCVPCTVAWRLRNPSALCDNDT